jgi:hypothetical protein
MRQNLLREQLKDKHVQKQHKVHKMTKLTAVVTSVPSTSLILTHRLPSETMN